MLVRPRTKMCIVMTRNCMNGLCALHMAQISKFKWNAGVMTMYRLRFLRYYNKGVTDFTKLFTWLGGWEHRDAFCWQNFNFFSHHTHSNIQCPSHCPEAFFRWQTANLFAVPGLVAEHHASHHVHGSYKVIKSAGAQASSKIEECVIVPEKLPKRMA